ncbi:hypothetical protein [Paenibacillus sp. GP183]|jgi:hypothetical protein|uniref:hypothetical protein n=1 Tax=Paenibacillus sp. GP183 TaxID=1882751 RepID=UPI00089AB333|nr:hypothetical protein [Paenibacillus sp. GP183]SEB42909.1 hypothetical protein SAMN05443246_0255 [Paenibacillus sp. GP183]
MYESYLSELLKTIHAFDQVVFARNTNNFVFFEGLKNGVIVKIRYNIEDKHFEAFDYSKWLPL